MILTRSRLTFRGTIGTSSRTWTDGFCDYCNIIYIYMCICICLLLQAFISISSCPCRSELNFSRHRRRHHLSPHHSLNNRKTKTFYLLLPSIVQQTAEYRVRQSFIIIFLGYKRISLFSRIAVPWKVGSFLLRFSVTQFAFDSRRTLL